METSVDDRVQTAAFDRPDTRNAISVEMAHELAAQLREAAERNVRAFVLTGRGEAFCAGGDIEAMQERTNAEKPEDAYRRVEETLNTVIREILSAPFPVIAKVNGDAVGAGTNLAAACDFAIATRDARFGEVFVNVGLIPDSGGTYLLPQLVGLRTARELAMTGRVFAATEAAEIDLITEAVTPDQLDDRVDELLATLDGKPTSALGAIKRGMHGNLGRHLDEALEREALLQALAYESDAHREGIQAFLESRDPEFD